MDTGIAPNYESLRAPAAPGAAVAARAFARLAAAADPNPDAALYFVSNDDLEAHKRRMEAFAPTIDHKPVVSLFDAYGNERIITAPLPLSERFDPETISDPRKRAGFKKWIKGNRAAREAREMNSMAEFACRVIDDEKEKPKKARSSKKIEDNPAKAAAQAEAIERAQFKKDKPQRERQRRKDRRERFVQNGKVIRADRNYLPFSEEFESTGLRTELGLFGPAIFNSRIARGAAYGKCKREVYDGKELAPIDLRDMEYLVEGWDKVRGNIVVDLDGRLDGRKWKTRADLRKDLVEALGPKLMPTMAPYRLDKDGDIEGAHLFWVLPPGSEVGVCGKSKGGPVRLHGMVQDALIAALLHLGADPGHTNAAKSKNPLAPRFSLMCWENFPDLSELKAGLPTFGVDRKEMRREHAKLKRKGAGDDEAPKKPQSLLKFNTMNDCWKEAIREGFRTHDKKFLAGLKAESSTAYGKWLKADGIPRIREALNIQPDTELPEDVRKILDKQITWRCANRPSIQTRYYDGDNRGRDKEAQQEAKLVGAELPEAREIQGKRRKSLAGIVTRVDQAEKSQATILEQVELYARLGHDPADKEAVARFVIRSGKLGKTTVYKWLPAVLASFRDASRYNAGRGTGTNDRPSILSETIEAAVVPASVDMIVSDAAVASAATRHGKPGQTIEKPSCPPAEPSSSRQACRGRPPAEPTPSDALSDVSTDPAAHPSTWLRFGGRWIGLDTDSMLHADHDTIQ